MEKIVNGTFDTDLGSWTNFGTSDFLCPGGVAEASSGDTALDHVRDHSMKQSFGVSGLATTALLSVGALWDNAAGDAVNGQSTFTVVLTDPAGVSTTLVTAVKGVGSGGEWICDFLDVSSYMTLIGTYTLSLSAKVRAGRDGTGGSAEYFESLAYYDDISLIVAERAYKTIVESIGGAESPSKFGLEIVDDSAGLFEFFTTMMGKFLRIKAGLHEFLGIHVTCNSAEATGVAESYSTHVGKRRSIPINELALVEYLRARWTLGNTTMERNILSPVNIWTTIAKILTNWETA